MAELLGLGIIGTGAAVYYLSQPYHDMILRAAILAKDLTRYKCRHYTATYFENGITTDVPANNTLEIKYYLRDIPYTIVVPKKRGPHAISRVLDINDENITDLVRPKLGPCGNFHGIPTTPKMLGYHDGLFVCYRQGAKTFYQGTDTIKIEIRA